MFDNVRMRKNVRSSNATSILIGWALSHDLVAIVTSDILGLSYILKLRVNLIIIFLRTYLLQNYLNLYDMAIFDLSICSVTLWNWRFQDFLSLKRIHGVLGSLLVHKVRKGGKATSSGVDWAHKLALKKLGPSKDDISEDSDVS